jgi:hypothetical protein
MYDIEEDIVNKKTYFLLVFCNLAHNTYIIHSRVATVYACWVVLYS